MKGSLWIRLSVQAGGKTTNSVTMTATVGNKIKKGKGVRNWTYSTHVEEEEIRHPWGIFDFTLLGTQIEVMRGCTRVRGRGEAAGRIFLLRQFDCLIVLSAFVPCLSVCVSLSLSPSVCLSVSPGPTSLYTGWM